MRYLLSAILLLPAGPVLAHHPLSGRPMQVFSDGLLSGIGHPILGFDHLFFVLAIGLAAGLVGSPARAPLAYLVAMLVGCFALYAGWNIPLREPMIAVSLLVVGGVLASGRALQPVPLTMMFAAFGLFHGAAFGVSIAAQEGGASGVVLTGYLIGLGITQYLLALVAGVLGTRLMGRSEAGALSARMAGAMVAGIGLFLCLEAIEGPMLALITSS